MPAQDGQDEIVVSGGGSAASLPLCRAAIEAARLVTGRIGWRLLVGHGVPAADFDALKAGAPPHMVVERARPDFPALLARSALSISQAGYNTVLDLAAAHARAILVPFAAGNEQEQTIRAGELARRGLGPRAGDRRARRRRLGARGRRPDRRAAPGLVGDPRRRGEAHGGTRLRPPPTAPRPAPRPGGRSMPRWSGRAPLGAPSISGCATMTPSSRPPRSRPISPAPGAGACRRRSRSFRRGQHPQLAAYLADHPTVDVLVHGWAHRNHAPAGARASEFGIDRPEPDKRADAERGLARIGEIFGERALPVFVPPWNRIDPGFAAALPQLGYSGALDP